MVQQLTNALDSKESGRRGFSLYPKGANLLTRISIVLFSTYFALKIAYEISYAIAVYNIWGTLFIFRPYYILTYALLILVLLIVILMSKGKSNLSFILSLLIFLVFLLDPRRENIIFSLSILNDSNFPNTNPFELLLYFAPALLGVLLCSALLCLVLGRVNRKK